MSDSGARATAIAAAEEHYASGAFKDTLAARVAIPTESAEPNRQPDLMRYLTDDIAPAAERMGYRCSIHDNPSPRGGWPFLVAERIEDENLPTLLTYGHGDVVVGLDDLWTEGDGPWNLKVEGNRWYGRGTADNKAQHSIIMAALERVLENRGRHGFNSKILLDMGEEIGSPGLDLFVEQQKELLAADMLIASDGPRMKIERPDIKLGNRGSINFELIVDLREGSRHSGHWGGVLSDPGVILAHAIATIVNEKGQIKVPGWTPAEIPDNIRALFKDCHVDPGNDFPDIDPEWGEPGLSRAEKMFGWTSFIVLAFITGQPDNPVNGVQPSAKATCQLRFTVDADHTKFLENLRTHLDAHGFDQVQVVEPEDNRYFPAQRTDPDNPWVRLTHDSVAATMGEAPIVVPNSAGGLPSRLFADHLGVPTIWLPHSYTGCKQHGPNEHVLDHLMRDGLKIMTGIFWDLGEVAG